jgi:hypothetical protein
MCYQLYDGGNGGLQRARKKGSFFYIINKKFEYNFFDELVIKICLIFITIIDHAKMWKKEKHLTKNVKNQVASQNFLKLNILFYVEIKNSDRSVDV